MWLIAFSMSLCVGYAWLSVSIARSRADAWAARNNYTLTTVKLNWLDSFFCNGWICLDVTVEPPAEEPKSAQVSTGTLFNVFSKDIAVSWKVPDVIDYNRWS